MADSNAKALHERGERLFSKKQALDSLNQEIALYCYPERADFTNSDRALGEEFATHLFDSSPVLARRDLCNMFSSMLRPRGQPWFGATLGDDELMERQPIRALCDAITKIMRRHFYTRSAQFSRATKQVDHDYGTFGNGVLFLGINRGYDGLLFRCFHPRDCAWVEGPDGCIDEGGAFWRKFKMSARNIERAYPKAALAEAVKQAVKNDPDREFTLCHVMMPADEYDYSKRRRGRMEWASIYYDHDNMTLLDEDGSHEFRYIVPRWATISGSPYAVSPAAITALPDARGIQTMARVLLEAGEKSVDPPTIAREEAIVGEINLYSGGTTWVERDYSEKDYGPPLAPILLGKQVAIGVELLLHAREKLKDCFYLTKLNLPQQGTRTAYEAAQLVEEFVRANIPLFEPIETEYNAPMLSLASEVLHRHGAFEEIFQQYVPLLSPQEREAVMGREVEFDFSNPLQDAVERNKANQASIVFGAAAAAKEIDPESLQELDVPYIVRDVTRGTGAPAKWNRDPEAAAQRKEQQAAVGDVLGALGAAGQAAEVVKTGTEAAANLNQIGVLGPQPADAETAYGPT